MHIGVDMDSVIADIVHPLIRFHNNVYKTKTKYSEHKTFDLSPLWNCPLEETINRIHEFYHSPYFEQVKPITGSRRSIGYLRKKHTLSLITARPYSIEDKTKAWLKLYFPDSFSYVHHTNLAAKKGHPRKNKSEVCLQNKVDLIIEDHLEYAYDCLSAGVEVILFNQPWNQTKNLPRGMRRVYSWKEIRL